MLEYKLRRSGLFSAEKVKYLLQTHYSDSMLPDEEDEPERSAAGKETPENAFWAGGSIIFACWTHSRHSWPYSFSGRVVILAGQMVLVGTASLE